MNRILACDTVRIVDRTLTCPLIKDNWTRD
jgi:hypothetical protein